MNKTTAEKFEGFFGLFEPKSIEMALNHFLHKPIDKRYKLSTCEDHKHQIVEIEFPDGSIFTRVEKLK